jgi:hypothetical protein
MQELSIEEMKSLRGGAHRAQNQVNALSFGNIALAFPISISVLSGTGNVSQVAEAIAGTQSVKFLGV